ncbi:MAG: hypothetical protein GWN02_19590 [Gemmatimonadetes bacterium]|nr:hypothetical protein [Gemmatimonadota bacterium]
MSAARVRAETERCLECGGPHAAACVVSCPAEIDVPGFIAAIARDDVDRAADPGLRQRTGSSSVASSGAPRPRWLSWRGTPGRATRSSWR